MGLIKQELSLPYPYHLSLKIKQMVIDFKKFEKTQPHIARIDFLLDYRIYLVVSIFLNLIMKPE